MKNINSFCQVKLDKNKVQLNNSCVKLNFTSIMSESFGQWLKEQRLARRWSQDDLADKSKVSKSTISLLEKDKIAQPRFGNLDNIAKALGVSVEEMRQVLTNWQNGQSQNYSFKKPTNPAELFGILEELGLDVQFSGGFKMLQTLDEDDLQELLDGIVANASAKVKRKMQAIKSM